MLYSNQIEEKQKMCILLLFLTLSSRGIGKLYFPQKYVTDICNFLDSDAIGPFLTTVSTLVLPNK